MLLALLRIFLREDERDLCEEHLTEIRSGLNHAFSLNPLSCHETLSRRE